MTKRTREDAKRNFTRDTAEHVLQIVHDDGLFRHLTCKKPGTYAYHFHITTWPGYLAVTGDMGSYVFWRLDDMFAFFRNDRKDINPSYWREKLVAISREGAQTYDPDRFHETIISLYKEWLKDHRDEFTLAQRRDIRNEIREQVLDRADDEHEAYHAARRFEIYDHQPFSDIWEYNLQTHTFHFLWCCWAIVWAIGQYDAQKAAVPAPSTSAVPAPSTSADPLPGFVA